jgi:hypothetical protein
LKMMTLPATDAAMRLSTMNTIRIWVRTDRPNHSEVAARVRQGGGLGTSARMDAVSLSVD